MARCVAVALALASAISLLAAEPAVQLLMPAGALSLAAADLAKIEAPLRESMRYLWVPPHVDTANGLDMVYRVLCGHCNSMSREPDLVPLYIVPGSGNRLLRLSLKDYRWDRKVWESFAAMPDPYFYDLVDEYWPGGSGYAAGNYKVPAIAAWAADGPGKPAAAQILAGIQPETGKVRAPIASVTCFAFTTFVSVNGSPKYNDFLAIKNEGDYFKATGVRADEDEAFEANLLAVIAESGITYEPRAIEKRSKVGGELWRSHDFIKAVNAADPFRNLGRDEKKILRAKADAHENFAHAANGMWIVGLFDGAGAAQDNAPDSITSGDTTTTNTRDHRVHLPLSCVRCHSDGGLQDLDDWVRNLQQPPPVPPLSLLVGNKSDPGNLKPVVDEVLRFRRQYGRTLIPALQMGRQRYAIALGEITGMKPEQYAQAYGKVWQQLCEPKIDSAWAARDLGCSEAELVGAIDKQVKLAGGTDPILAGFLKPKATQKPIQLRQWLTTYPRAQKTLRGIVDVQLQKPKGKP